MADRTTLFRSDNTIEKLYNVVFKNGTNLLATKNGAWFYHILMIIPTKKRVTIGDSSWFFTCNYSKNGTNLLAIKNAWLYHILMLTPIKEKVTIRDSIWFFTDNC